MTADEMKQEFDVLYNNIMSNAAPGLDDYEISLFLTKAQEELLKAYFNPKGNKYAEGFDFSPKRQVDFSNIIVTKAYDGANCFTKELAGSGYKKYDIRSYVGQILQDFGTPSDPGDETRQIFLRLSEYVRPAVHLHAISVWHYLPELQVMPIMYSEYSKFMTKPYRYPLKNFCWRIEFAGEMSGVSEFIFSPDIFEKAGQTEAWDTDHNPIRTFELAYYLRYLRKPKPIIVGDLTAYTASIDGVSAVTSCELDPIIHREIIQRAVEIAKSAYLGDLKSTVTLGQRSE